MSIYDYGIVNHMKKITTFICLLIITFFCFYSNMFAQTATPLYYIDSIRGQKAEVLPVSLMNITVTGREAYDNSYTIGRKGKNREGFNVQAYVYKDKGDDKISLQGNNYLPPNPAESSTGIYNTKDRNWEIKLVTPSEPGDYFLQIALYCSDMSAYCGKKYRSFGQYEKLVKFKVVSSLPKYQFTRWMSVDMSGDDVTELQKRLLSYGIDNDSVTGYFWLYTKEAVKRFQQTHGLNPTGVVGPATIKVLNSK